MHAKSLQWCPTLCNPMNCSPSDSSVRGSLQARIQKWVLPPRYLLDLGIKSISLTFPALAGKFFTTTAITTIVFLTFVLFLSWLHCKVCGLLVPDQGSNPCTLQWKCGVLTTGQQGKSHHWVFLILKVTL